MSSMSQKSCTSEASHGRPDGHRVCFRSTVIYSNWEAFESFLIIGKLCHLCHKRVVLLRHPTADQMAIVSVSEVLSYTLIGKLLKAS